MNVSKIMIEMGYISRTARQNLVTYPIIVPWSMQTLEGFEYVLKETEYFDMLYPSAS